MPRELYLKLQYLLCLLCPLIGWAACGQTTCSLILCTDTIFTNLSFLVDGNCNRILSKELRRSWPQSDVFSSTTDVLLFCALPSVDIRPHCPWFPVFLHRFNQPGLLFYDLTLVLKEGAVAWQGPQQREERERKRVRERDRERKESEWLRGKMKNQIEE